MLRQGDWYLPYRLQRSLSLPSVSKDNVEVTDGSTGRTLVIKVSRQVFLETHLLKDASYALAEKFLRRIKNLK